MSRKRKTPCPWTVTLRDRDGHGGTITLFAWSEKSAKREAESLAKNYRAISAKRL